VPGPLSPITPANIIMAGGSQAKLTDFGIAHTVGDTRLTRSGVMGTQAYMAPELFDSAPITPAADLWSLGATIYHAADGHGPFERDTTGATLRAILIEDLPAPRCPAPLAAAITGLLQRDPAQRASIGQAHAALQVAAQAPALRPPWTQLPTTRSPAPPPVPPRAAAPEPPPPGLPRRPGRDAVIAISAAVALAAILGGMLAASHLGTAHPKPPAIHPRLIATLSDPGGEGADTLAFSPVGNTLATGNGSGTAYLWDTASHSITATLPDPHSQGVNSVAFSPDGKILATADVNGSAYVWSTATHRVTATLTDPYPSDGVNWVAFSPDGKTLAAADANGCVYLWDVSTRSVIATLTSPKSGNPVNSVAFSPDGKTLAAGDDGSAYLWQVAQGG